jgi:PAS domain S-box-containing protein
MKKFSLKIWMFLFSSVLVTGICAAISLFSYKQSVRLLLQDFESNGDVIVKSFAFQASDGIIIEDPFVLNQICKGILAEKKVIYTLVYDHKKNLLYQLHKKSSSGTSDSELMEQPISEEIKIFLQKPIKNKKEVKDISVSTNRNYFSGMLDLVESVPDRYDPEKTNGYVRIGLSLAKVAVLKKQLITNFIIILFIFFIAGSIISFFLAKGLSSQLQKIIKTMGNVISSADLSERIEYKSYIKETHDIQSHFNRMAEKLMVSQKTLKESEEKFKSISLTAQDAIIMIDHNNLISFWNRAASKIFGYSHKEAINQNFLAMIVPEQYHTSHHKHFPDFINTGKGTFVGKTVEFEAKRKSGEHFPIELSLSGINLEGKWNPIGIVRDISLRKKDEIELEKHRKNLEHLVKERTKELEKAHKELVSKAIEAGRAQLSAMVLHNIGNAITPVNINFNSLKAGEFKEINNFLAQCYNELKDHKQDLGRYVTKNARGKKIASFMGELIESFKTARKKQDEKLEKIGTGLDYVSEILTLQQSYSSKKQGTKQKTNFNFLVKDSIRMQQTSIDKRNITLTTDLGKNIPELIIEKNKLMQVVVNLIKNSCDAITQLSELDEFKEPDTRQKENWINIDTSFSDSKKNIQLKISDSGIGVEKDKLNKIFEFGVSTKGSSGVGLYYCKSFVEANDGTLTFESQGQGKGATVTIEFNASNNTGCA